MKTIQNTYFPHAISVIALLACLCSNLVFAKEKTEQGSSFSLTSKYLNEKRPYRVDVPDACKKADKQTQCPVLYVLDAGWYFDYLSELLSMMNISAILPDTILVGIPNTSDRTRDLTPTNSSKDWHGNTLPFLASSGGGEAFLDFLEKELLPEIDARYHPIPYRIFTGHSFGGLTVLHSLTTRPHLFQAHIALDPSLWWDNKKLLEKQEALLAHAKNMTNKVYLSVADHIPKGDDGLMIMEVTAKRFAYALEANGSPNLTFKLEKFSGEDHASIGLASLYSSLKFIFDGYENIPPSILKQGTKSLEQYYADYLSGYGITLSPPENIILGLSYQSMHQGKYELALEYGKLNLKHHPKSAAVHTFLSTLYQTMDKQVAADKHAELAKKLKENKQ